MSQDFHEAITNAHASALWERRPDDPGTFVERGHVWRWSELSPLLDRSIAETDMTNAERRVLVLENPAYQGSHRRGASLNMVVNLQVLMPGETARPHRHRTNALRFVIESDGHAVTTVDGTPYRMMPGDLLLTPGWCWHEHSHDGENRAVWLDALDVPLQHHFQCNDYEAGPSNDMPSSQTETAFNSTGILPVTSDESVRLSPMVRYPLESVRRALAAMPAMDDGSRRIRYVNPATGGFAMAGLDCYMLSLAPDFDTRPFRSTANTVCLVVEGEGTSSVGEDRLDWTRNDIINLPRGQWTWHRARGGHALLFQLTDREVLARLGYLRENYRDP